MNYSKIYNSLIKRARERKLNCYVEKHHVIPRCLGGSDDIENVVELTPEEHFLCHQLLVRIYPQHNGLLFAARIMTVGRFKKNKLYGWLRRKLKESLTGKSLSQKTKDKISEALKGRKLSKSTVKKISDKNRIKSNIKCHICDATFGTVGSRNKHCLRHHEIDLRKWKFDN